MSTRRRGGEVGVTDDGIAVPVLEGDCPVLEGDFPLLERELELVFLLNLEKRPFIPPLFSSVPVALSLFGKGFRPDNENDRDRRSSVEPVDEGDRGVGLEGRRG